MWGGILRIGVGKKNLKARGSEKTVFSELLKMITKTRSARGKTQCRFDLAEYTFAPESWFCIRTDHVLLVLFRFVASDQFHRFLVWRGGAYISHISH